MALYALTSKWLMSIQLAFDPAHPSSVGKEWWMLPNLPLHLAAPGNDLRGVPAHILSDLTKFASSAAMYDPRVAEQGVVASWEAILSMFLVTMSSPVFAPNLHVRAEMGDAVYSCFLPEFAKRDDSRCLWFFLFSSFADALADQITVGVMRLSARESLIETRYFCLLH